jgi:hypothetical protein
MINKIFEKSKKQESIDFSVDYGPDKIAIVNSTVDGFCVFEDLLHFFVVQRLTESCHYLFQVAFCYVSALLFVEKGKCL